MKTLRKANLTALLCALSATACTSDASTHEAAVDEQTNASSGEHTNGDGGLWLADSGMTPGSTSSGDGARGTHAGPDGSRPATSDGGPSSVAADAGAPDVLPSDGNGERFFLPTGEPTNTAAPRVEVDAAGNTHAVYPAYFHGDAFYTYCEGDCRDASKRAAVRFETEGTVNNALLRLTKDGRPRVLLSGALHNYWAECDRGCLDRANWTVAKIQSHGGDLDVTGEALALDPEGRPRFLVHTYRALLGIGQKTPETSLAQCDANCSQPASWRFDVIARDELWVGSSFQYDAGGKAHVATHVFPFGAAADSGPRAAYLSCSGACNAEHTWKGIGFFPPYESTTEAVDIRPSISLALTKAGQPRIVQLAKTQAGDKAVVYFECDGQCEGDHWTMGFSLTSNTLADGVDLALDARDRPRFVMSLNYDIVLLSCDAADCTVTDNWQHADVERGSDIPADAIFLEYNCNVGAWFLHSPSLAWREAGAPRVGYQIRDVSGGGPSTPDPTKPGCIAGTDMTLSRLAALSSYME
ncbi:MAG: hypothetical protein JWN48_571 [Myxococcaceae bacterium]|nr:hypothetical protein [Myxococcaceae bacterium]